MNDYPYVYYCGLLIDKNLMIKSDKYYFDNLLKVKERCKLLNANDPDSNWRVLVKRQHIFHMEMVNQ
ncbi:hypothetical protein [Lentilactobacillus kribbianus]|uniref:hypothetical protein n=1 Tax=Lentilactobacillus kribbianus TaxID=2729622 RepID=UPI001553A2FD|nr:hypothetical protein [Lentilactobacillus kribbianus]